MTTDIVHLEPIDVMWVRAIEAPNAEAFVELEAVVGLRGRRFYGTYDEQAGKYWACVQRREEDDRDSLGLSAGTIEGGLYASARLRGDYDDLVSRIAPTFEALTSQHTVDPSRPSIEFYRRHNEFVLYLPVVESRGG